VGGRGGGGGWVSLPGGRAHVWREPAGGLWWGGTWGIPGGGRDEGRRGGRRGGEWALSGGGSVPAGVYGVPASASPAVCGPGRGVFELSAGVVVRKEGGREGEREGGKGGGVNKA